MTDGKFNPAVLPTEFMKKFEQGRLGKVSALPLSRAVVRYQRSNRYLDHTRIVRRHLPLGPAQKGGRHEPLSLA